MADLVWVRFLRRGYCCSSKSWSIYQRLQRFMNRSWNSRPSIVLPRCHIAMHYSNVKGGRQLVQSISLHTLTGLASLRSLALFGSNTTLISLYLHFRSLKFSRQIPRQEKVTQSMYSMLYLRHAEWIDRTRATEIITTWCMFPLY